MTAESQEFQICTETLQTKMLQSIAQGRAHTVSTIRTITC